MPLVLDARNVRNRVVLESVFCAGVGVVIINCSRCARAWPMNTGTVAALIGRETR